jgi:hypothetical protein
MPNLKARFLRIMVIFDELKCNANVSVELNFVH